MYEVAVERLTDAGLQQYEISNFARTGAASRHNMRYWQRRPYLGLGLDASSMFREALSAGGKPSQGYVLRSTTTDDLKGYLKAPKPAETAWLSPERQHEEAWFLGLRLNAGVSVSALREEFGQERVNRALEIVSSMVAAGLLVMDGDTVRLTPQGRLLSNDVFQQFLMSDTTETDERIDIAAA
jgi:oxygen-independent coproporphyrinogen-3 oxidase